MAYSGGSIRVPAAFCGIFGLKPSVARLPHGGLVGAHGGMENIVGCVGPMATCIEDLRLFCKASLDSIVFSLRTYSISRLSSTFGLGSMSLRWSSYHGSHQRK